MKHLRKKQVRRRAIEAAGSERGTMSIEMVVLVPVLLLITMVAVAGGRIVSAQGMVEAASRDAARAASMERSVGAASAAANRSLAQADTSRASCSAGMAARATDALGEGTRMPSARATARRRVSGRFA